MISVISWGAPVPFMASLMDRWDPLLFAAVRFSIAVPFLALLWRIGKSPEDRFWPKGVPLWCILRLTVIGIVGFAIIYSYAYHRLHPAMAAALTAASPVIAASVARILYKTPLAPGFGLAIGFSVAGGILATVNPDSLSGIELRGGEPLLILASCLWAWYSLEVQRTLPGLTQLHASLVTIAPAMILLPVIYLGSWALGLSKAPPAPEDIRLDDVAVLVWFGLMAAALAIVAWNWGVKLAGVVFASLYLNLVPLVILLVSLAIGIEPRLLQIVGLAVVLIGVLQAQLRRLKTPAIGNGP